jgi:hypothetical protein
MSEAPALAYDPALPQRDLLLDPRRVVPRLEAALSRTGRVPIAACEVVRVKYRVGESLRVRYRIETEDGEQALTLRAFANGGSEEAFRRSGGGVRPTGLLRPLAHLPELGSVVWVFPNDRKLDLDLVEPRSPALAAMLGCAPHRCRLVAYAPEKAATVRCEDAEGRPLAFVKIYREGDHLRPLHVHASLSGALAPGERNLELPHVIGSSSNAVALAPLDGPALEALRGRGRAAAYERLGAAVARLHSLPAPDDERFERLEPDRLRPAADVIARARPDVGAAAQRLVDQLEHAHEVSDEPRVCLHGDLHPKNALLRVDRIALIDLDQVATGHAAADLGGLLAGLRYDSLTGEIGAAGEGQLCQGVLAGYASVRPLPPATAIDWHTASALLVERALRAVNRIRPPGLRHLHEILDDAAERVRW